MHLQPSSSTLGTTISRTRTTGTFISQHICRYHHRRPVPVGAEDIGTWLDILQITSVCSVVTNAALVCYTMQLTSDFSDVGQLWIFIGFQYTIFVLMAIFAYLVDDMPEEVSYCDTRFVTCVLLWKQFCAI